MKWTDDQFKVIKLRDRNILVSAAAGSGKTAVLVERILDRITDGKKPLDIDRLVVVTFTKAAAAEMRERIGKALEERMACEPNDARLQKQASLLSHAQISTIDSFCMGVVRNYFHTIELDPGFRMGDEGEMELLKADVMEALLEANYAKCTDGGREADDFVNLVETFATGKSDKGLEEMVYRLYEQSMSNPWPMEWLSQCKDAFYVNTVRGMEESEWMKELMESVRKSLICIRDWNKEAVSLCDREDGPDMHREAMMDDEEMIQGLLNAEGYSQMYEAIKDVGFTRLSGKKGGDPDLRKAAGEYRKKVKKGITDIRSKYFYQSPERMLKDVNDSKDAVLSLIDLTMAFIERFREAKEEKNLLDFHDLEHFALRILTRKEDGKLAYTPVADELMEYYDEIMIDEYQDGNLVQETILNGVSKDRIGEPNLFMVGDVKQSIYRFRLARPELFMEKYERYEREDSLYQKIDLQKNFRSREVVLDGVNLLFGRIMKRDLGGVEYDKEAALNPGRVFDETERKTADGIDVLLVTKANRDDEAEENKNGFGLEEGFDGDSDEEMEKRKRMEAAVIGQRIRELTSKENGTYVNDGGRYRLAEYRDVVVLLRTLSGWVETFTEVLLSMGIPAYSDTKTGYFSTLEVQTVLNTLKIIDNPYQDIPLAAVLRSPIGGFSNEDLAKIRSLNKNGELYEALKEYRENGEVGECKDRTKEFLKWLDSYRTMVPYLKVYEFVQKLYDDTGYYHLVAAMPDGDRRSGNLDMLLQKAVEFDTVSYKGLFSFNRYMERLNKYEVDYGEASVMEGNQNAVRILSVHKSKGLEFPIVFVSGMGKRINQSDSRKSMVIHADLGVGTNCIDYEKRTKVPTIMQRAIQNRIKEENVGEEIRVLYVAMTRAKEKLILTGYVKKLEQTLEKWSNKGWGYLDLMNGTTYLDLIIPPLMEEDKEDFLLKQPFHYEAVTLMDENEMEEKERLLLSEKKERLLHWDADEIHDEDLYREMMRRRDYRYPYGEDLSLPILVSVSDLKRRSAKEEDAVEGLAELVRKKEPRPKFEGGVMKEKGVATWDVGTAYHTVMQHIRLCGLEGLEDVKMEMERLVGEYRIKEEEGKWISLTKLHAFCQSDLGRRMRLADENNVLHKEKPFVIGLPADEVDDAYKSKEMILVQGIIDAYFEEGEELVLVDYKTDEVEIGGEGELINRYGVQLALYRKALERVTKKKVKEVLIYSFSLNQAIAILES